MSQSCFKNNAKKRKNRHLPEQPWQDGNTTPDKKQRKETAVTISSSKLYSGDIPQNKDARKVDYNGVKRNKLTKPHKTTTGVHT